MVTSSSKKRRRKNSTDYNLCVKRRVIPRSSLKSKKKKQKRGEGKIPISKQNQTRNVGECDCGVTGAGSPVCKARRKHGQENQSPLSARPVAELTLLSGTFYPGQVILYSPLGLVAAVLPRRNFTCWFDPRSLSFLWRDIDRLARLTCLFSHNVTRPRNPLDPVITWTHLRDYGPKVLVDRLINTLSWR